MKKAFIFGAGSAGRFIFDKQNEYEILGFIDNDKAKFGAVVVDNLKVISPSELSNMEYDKIIIGSLAGYEDIILQLNEMGVDKSKLDNSYLNINLVIDSRVEFLKSFSKMAKEVKGAVAEVGVFRGEFAKEINRVFPEKSLYLFDTFEGFDQRDIDTEKVKGEFYDSFMQAGHFSVTNENIVIAKMPNPQKCIVKKGYFPATATGLENESFCFVNLDADLYQPTLEGLKFFYPRMESGGCILIHDYFATTYPNVEKAVRDFEIKENIKLKKIPIGDTLSIAIVI